MLLCLWGWFLEERLCFLHLNNFRKSYQGTCLVFNITFLLAMSKSDFFIPHLPIEYIMKLCFFFMAFHLKSKKWCLCAVSFSFFPFNESTCVFSLCSEHLHLLLWKLFMTFATCVSDWQVVFLLTWEIFNLENYCIM